MQYVLGLDLGTSSLKGVLVSEEGRVIDTVSHSYGLSTPAPGYSEQTPEDWIKAAESVIKELLQNNHDMQDNLKGISFSGQMHSLVLLDSENEVIRPAILWNDVRNSKQVDQLMSDYQTELIAITQNIALEGFTLPKILWVQENEPDQWNRVRKILLPKDYLGWWLTGNYHMDYSDAAGTLLMDLKEKKWSSKILEKYAIDKDVLPVLTSSDAMIGRMSDSLRDKFGFKQNIQIFAGGADNACAALGAGILDESVGMASIGTSGVFLSYERDGDQNYQGKLHYFHHTAKDAYYTMGVTLSAGHSLSWFRDTFASSMSYDELLDGIDQLPLGSNGLLFTPYLVGERTPYRDDKIRGSFIGLDSQHTLKHLARAVLEGITFSLKDSQMIMKSVANKSFDKIVSVGGGAKNSTWLQMQADIFNSEIVTLQTEQGPGFGAAMIAAVGLGWFDSYTDCAKAFVSYDKHYYPNQENVEKYQKIYDIYRQVYDQTKGICHQLSEV